MSWICLGFSGEFLLLHDGRNDVWRGPYSFRAPFRIWILLKHQIWSSFSDRVWQLLPWGDVTEESTEHNVSSSLLVPVKVGGLMIHSLQREHMKCLFNTHIQTEIGPQPPWGLTSLPLLQTVCLCVSLNNLTMTIPPLLLCLITPLCTFSVLSRRRIRDRTDFRQHLGGGLERVGDQDGTRAAG